MLAFDLRFGLQAMSDCTRASWESVVIEFDSWLKSGTSVSDFHVEISFDFEILKFSEFLNWRFSDVDEFTIWNLPVKNAVVSALAKHDELRQDSRPSKEGAYLTDSLAFLVLSDVLDNSILDTDD